MSMHEFVRLYDFLDPVFPFFRLAGPILMLLLALCLYYVAKSNSASDRREPIGSDPRTGLAAPGQAQFEHAPSEKKSSFPAPRTAVMLSFLSIASATVMLADQCRDFLFNSLSDSTVEPNEDPSSFYKGVDDDKFETALNSAAANIKDGNKATAEVFYREALKLKKVDLEKAAKPLDGLARLRIEEGRFEAAEPLASIAAGLDKAQPDYVNTYARILIETCRLNEALDQLKGLEVNNEQNFESIELRQLAEAQAEPCANASSDS